MKFAVEHAKRLPTTDLILSHFFNARGSELERSTEGMYRTLILRLLRDLSAEAIEHLELLYGSYTGDSIAGGANRSTSWPIPELVRLLKSTVEKLPNGRSVTMYIDALDECHEDEVRAMLRVFRSLVKDAWHSGQQLRVCFASRPHPDTNFNDAIFLDFSTQSKHLAGITKYIDDELSIGSSSLAQSIRSKLREKAAGSFMWTKLVVNILNKEHDRGNLGRLHTKLQEIPSGLHQLYAYTLDRYCEDRDAMLVCFRWMLCGHGFTSVQQLWGAIQRGLERNDEEIRKDFGTLAVHDMARYVIGISKGFIDVTTRVQFIHESVRDFLLEASTLRNLYQAESLEEFRVQSLDLLKTWCAAEAVSHRSELESAVKATKLASSFTSWTLKQRFSMRDMTRPSFAAYAAEYIMAHTQQASSSGLDQTAFLETLAEQMGPYFIATSARTMLNSADTFQVVPGLTCLIMESNSWGLLRDTQLKSVRRARRCGRAFGLDWEEGSTISPVWLAIELGRITSVTTLMGLYLQMEARHPVLQEILQYLLDYWEKFPLGGFGPYPGVNPLLEIARNNPSLALFFLLALAGPGSLDPHLEEVAHIVTRRRIKTQHFLEMLLFFIQKQIPCEAFAYNGIETMAWVSRHSKSLKPGDEGYKTCSSILRLVQDRLVGPSSS